MIFAVLGNLITNFSPPRSPAARKTLDWLRLYASIFGAVVAFSAVVLSGAAFLPDQFLFVLGNRSSHLHHELLLMVGGAILSMIASTLWTPTPRAPGSLVPGYTFHLPSEPISLSRSLISRASAECSPSTSFQPCRVLS